MIIPEEAFVSNYSMVLKGETYTAMVEEKEKARKTYQNSKDISGFIRENYITESKDTKKVSIGIHEFLIESSSAILCIADKILCQD